MTKLKYGLPVAQIAVAIFLLHQYRLWMMILTTRSHMPGPGAAATLLGLINLPIASLRGVSIRCFDVFWPDWIFVVALAIFWYWAGREIESRLERRARITIKSQLARISTDLLLTVSSVLFFLWNHADVRWFPWSYFVPSLLFLLIWAFAPPVLLAYDLFSIARRN